MPSNQRGAEKHSEWLSGSKKDYEALRVDQLPHYAATGFANMQSKVARDAIAKDLQLRPTITLSNVRWLNSRIKSLRDVAGNNLEDNRSRTWHNQQSTKSSSSHSQWDQHSRCKSQHS